MTRKLTDNLKSDLLTYLPDNNQGLITPTILRQILADTIDSLRPAWAGLLGDHTSAPVSYPLSAAWEVLKGPTLFLAAQVSDPLELAADIDDGNITVQYSEYFHQGTGLIAFEGATGTEYQFAIGVNGAPVGSTVISSLDGAGAGRIVATQARATLFPAAGSHMQFLARCPGGASTITISQIQFIASLLTTRYI